MTEKKKEHSFSLKVSKDGIEPKIWYKMETINDIYQQACLLNEKDCNKMLEQFKEAIELAVSMRQACEAELTEPSDLKLPYFRWASSE